MRGAKPFLSLLFFVVASIAFGQASTQQEETERFILKVVSEYKNPMAYYPLRRDIFLPDEEEAEAIERKADYPEGATVSGSFIFLGEDDELDRPRFVDSQGKLMFGYSPYKGWSQKGSYQYQKRKFELISNGTPALGRFLYLYGKVED